jgi:hypothetical protein
MRELRRVIALSALVPPARKQWFNIRLPASKLSFDKLSASDRNTIIAFAGIRNT